jgi:hypothetical protein
MLAPLHRFGTVDALALLRQGGTPTASIEYLLVRLPLPLSTLVETNPLQRLIAEIKRRAGVVGIFPNDASIVRLVGAVILKQGRAWCLNLR